MQTDSSASFRYGASLSAVEYTTTDSMPISRQARMMRRAISPRFAIRILLNMRRVSGGAHEEELLSVLHGLAAGDKNTLDHAARLGLDLAENLHRLDEADGRI